LFYAVAKGARVGSPRCRRTRLRMLKPLLYGKNLRTAGRTPIHFVWQASHLRVTTLTGVTAHGVRQFEYLAQRFQKRSGEEVPAESAMKCVVSEGLQFGVLTERAAQRVELGSHRIMHSP
jgi:hypothetical protein